MKARASHKVLIVVAILGYVFGNLGYFMSIEDLETFGFMMFAIPVLIFFLVKLLTEKQKSVKSITQDLFLFFVLLGFVVYDVYQHIYIDTI